jgi:hypothetical protein
MSAIKSDLIPSSDIFAGYFPRVRFVSTVRFQLGFYMDLSILACDMFILYKSLTAKGEQFQNLNHV